MSMTFYRSYFPVKLNRFDSFSGDLFKTGSLVSQLLNKAGYTATLVACGWAGAVMEKVTGVFGQEL